MTEDLVTNPRVQVATPADLAAAREARGLSPVDISQRIKLQVRQVNALEEGQWDALPGKSFVRGALRSYGKLLDVDVTALLGSIGGIAESTQVQSLRPMDSSVSRASGLGLDGGSRGTPILWVIAGLVGVVAVVLYFGSGQDNSGLRAWLPAGQTAPAAPTEPTVSAPVAQADSAAASVQVPDAGSQHSTPASTSASTSALPVSSTTATAPAPESSGLTTAPSVVNGGSVAEPGTAQTAASHQAGVPYSGADAGAKVADTTLPVTSDLTLPRSSAASVETITGEAAAQATSAVAADDRNKATKASVPAKVMETAKVTEAAKVTETADAAAATAAVSKNAKGAVRLSAVGQDSWVEVREADGAILHHGLIKAGQSVDLIGKPPYRLVIGNASRVELRYDGKIQALATHTGANNIARLQLK